MERDWTPGLCRLLGLAAHDLPAIWDADFFHGEAPDAWALCEINASSVFPIPDEAPAAIARTIAARLGVGAPATG